MKLSDYQIAIERAYTSLLHDIALQTACRDDFAFNYIRRRPAHVLPREQAHPLPPLPVMEYEPDTITLPFHAKEKMVQLAAFQSTFHDSVTPFTPDMVPLIFDTGASISISPCHSDFVTPLREVQHITIKGVASGLQAKGIGDLSYTFVNNAGETQTLLLRNCLYVPDCAVRLTCPRQIGAVTGNPNDGLYVTAPGTVLVVEGKHTTIKYDSLSQLPVMFTKPGISSYIQFATKLQAHSTSLMFSSAVNQNLTKRQKQKLYLHELCAHEGFRNLNHWIRKGLCPGVDPSLASEPDPLCASCCFGKARRLTHKTHTGHISKEHTRPGQGVSSVGLESGTPGRPFTTKGSASNHRYNYVSFWVDHMSSFVYFTFHSSKAATELVKSKIEFEQYASRFNVKIENIRADNGIYTAQLFRDSCMKNQQNLTFCAVGAHWQNGTAEQFIGTVTQRARTILLHAMAKWPSVISEEMWPFALRHAVNFHNSSLRKDSSLSPYEAFTGQTSPWLIKDFRVFWVTDLCSSKGTSRWVILQ